MALDMSIVTRPIGPLPLWAWGALAGGGAILFAHLNGNRAASNLLDPSNPAITAPGDGGYGSGTGSTGTTDPTASGTNTTTGNSGESITDILGGASFGAFIAGLGPNFMQAVIGQGSTNLSVQNSPQNILDAANLANYYHAAEVNNTNFYHAQEVNNTNFYSAWASYWQSAANGGFGPGWPGYSGGNPFYGGGGTTPGVTSPPNQTVGSDRRY